MTNWKIIFVVLLISLVLFIVGDSKNEVLETQNNGASMCMACIGLE